MDTQERYSRQGDIVPQDKLSSMACTVIGVGAIGRQVALQLASIGVVELQLYDHDIIEETNIVTQGYSEYQVGDTKVEAISDECFLINEDALAIEQIDSKFNKDSKYHKCIFCCVDSIVTRSMIYDTVGYDTDFFVDGRMSAETMRVLTAVEQDQFSYYKSTLFPPEEAYVGACTAKSTIFCASIAAGLMISQFAKYLRGFPIDPDIQLNLLSNELIVTEPILTEGSRNG